MTKKRNKKNKSKKHKEKQVDYAGGFRAEERKV